ncbi:hypothetical protein KI688_011898 [Linnemannia hyalina]|uniref:Uncharacterized protein n=1 Tax=Linnemannia hyalina TaxID=64524 RepID=A0A9P7XV17_9FUNG|nr:hypothetical protein KI688_011898 [Linnemannia hyalina]
MKLRSLLSAATIQSEHAKNTRTIEKIPHGSILEQEGIKRARAVTPSQLQTDFNWNVATWETLRKKHKLEDKRSGPNRREYAPPYQLESIELSISTQLYTIFCVDGEDVLLFCESTETLADALKASNKGQQSTDIIFHALPGDGQEKVLSYFGGSRLNIPSYTGLLDFIKAVPPSAKVTRLTDPSDTLATMVPNTNSTLRRRPP